MCKKELFIDGIRKKLYKCKEVHLRIKLRFDNGFLDTHKKEEKTIQNKSKRRFQCVQRSILRDGPIVMMCEKEGNSAKIACSYII